VVREGYKNRVTPHDRDASVPANLCPAWPHRGSKSSPWYSGRRARRSGDGPIGRSTSWI
jgi:hypothetical protein